MSDTPTAEQRAEPTTPTPDDATALEAMPEAWRAFFAVTKRPWPAAWPADALDAACRAYAAALDARLSTVEAQHAEVEAERDRLRDALAQRNECRCRHTSSCMGICNHCFKPISGDTQGNQT